MSHLYSINRYLLRELKSISCWLWLCWINISIRERVWEERETDKRNNVVLRTFPPCSVRNIFFSLIFCADNFNGFSFNFYRIASTSEWNLFLTLEMSDHQLHFPMNFASASALNIWIVVALSVCHICRWWFASAWNCVCPEPSILSACLTESWFIQSIYIYPKSSFLILGKCEKYLMKMKFE